MMSVLGSGILSMTSTMVPLVRQVTALPRRMTRSCARHSECPRGSVRHDRSLSYSDLYFIAHATDVHDVRIGVGYFEYDLDDSTTGMAAYGLTASNEGKREEGEREGALSSTGSATHSRLEQEQMQTKQRGHELPYQWYHRRDRTRNIRSQS